MALYLYVPTLPLIAKSKASDLNIVGLALSMYGLGHIVIRMPVGILSGRWGRNKPLIFLGLTLVASGAIVMGISENIGQLALGRAITGIAAGTWVPLVLAFAALFSIEGGIQATVAITLVGSIARLTASGLNGFLTDIGGYPFPFYIAAGAAGLAILFLIPYREVVRPPSRITFVPWSLMMLGLFSALIGAW